MAIYFQLIVYLIILKGYLVNLTSDKGLKYLSNLKNLDIINISSFPLNKKYFQNIFFTIDFVFNFKIFIFSYIK